MNKRITRLDAQKIENLVNGQFLSFGELAKMAGISSATIFALRAGRRNASYKTVRKLAAALGVEPAEIIKEQE